MGTQKTHPGRRRVAKQTGHERTHEKHNPEQRRDAQNGRGTDAERTRTKRTQDRTRTDTQTDASTRANVSAGALTRHMLGVPRTRSQTRAARTFALHLGPDEVEEVLFWLGAS